MAQRRRSRIPLRERASERGLLAAAVTARREQLELRQDELAELAGSSSQFVHSLEAGKPTVQLDKVLAVLAVLGLHLEVERGASSREVTYGPALAELLGLDSAGDRPDG